MKFCARAGKQSPESKRQSVIIMYLHLAVLDLQMCHPAWTVHHAMSQTVVAFWDAHVMAAACAPDLGVLQGPGTDAAGEGAAKTTSLCVLHNEILKHCQSTNKVRA